MPVTSLETPVSDRSESLTGKHNSLTRAQKNASCCPKPKYQVPQHLEAGLHITAAGQSPQLPWLYWLRHSSFQAEVPQKRRNTGSLGTEPGKGEAVMGEWNRRVQLSWSSDAAPTQLSSEGAGKITSQSLPHSVASGTHHPYCPSSSLPGSSTFGQTGYL